MGSQIIRNDGKMTCGKLMDSGERIHEPPRSLVCLDSSSFLSHFSVDGDTFDTSKIFEEQSFRELAIDEFSAEPLNLLARMILRNQFPALRRLRISNFRPCHDKESSHSQSSSSIRPWKNDRSPDRIAKLEIERSELDDSFVDVLIRLKQSQAFSLNSISLVNIQWTSERTRRRFLEEFVGSFNLTLQKLRLSTCQLDDQTVQQLFGDESTGNTRLSTFPNLLEFDVSCNPMLSDSGLSLVLSKILCDSRDLQVLNISQSANEAGWSGESFVSKCLLQRLSTWPKLRSLYLEDFNMVMSASFLSHVAEEVEGHGRISELVLGMEVFMAHGIDNPCEFRELLRCLRDAKYLRVSDRLSTILRLQADSTIRQLLDKHTQIQEHDTALRLERVFQTHGLDGLYYVMKRCPTLIRS